MNLLSENLSRFFEKIKSLTFWQRIFGWRNIKKLSYDAYEEYKNLLSSFAENDESLRKKNHEIELLKKDNAQVESLKKELSDSKNEIQKLIKENTIFKQTEDSRKNEYEKNVAGVNAIREHLQSEIKRIQDERENEITEKFKRMKETWTQHEENVKNAIKSICQRNAIEYWDKEKIPFKGKPDNTIKIAGEFIIFDAKSPASDDLKNFWNYVKGQTEEVKKYAKIENVKRDIFLVIPSNTVDVIEEFSFNMADYKVYVITINALEPIILCLQKIEEYEFAEELSPEERENICRIIGKFAHTTKRKIQIDYFFSQEFLSILTKCKTDLPEEILKEVIEYEKSEKINPPQEKRVKQILTADLEKDGQKIKKEAEAKDIVFPPSLSDIKKLPLSADES